MGTLIVYVLTVPMAWHLLRIHPVRVPKGFGLWMLFCLWVLVSLTMIGHNPPQALPGTASDRLVSVAFNLSGYLAITVALLYAGNLSESDYPRARMVRQLGGLFVVTVLGGLAGTFAGTFSYTSLVERLLPPSVRNDSFVQSLVHPSTAQLQDVLGYQSARPAAPFGYTNSWGYCLSILLCWFVVGYLVRAGRGRRLLGIVILLAAVIPVTTSLNRGLWLGLGLSVAYIAFRLAMMGRVVVVGALGLVAAIGMVLFIFSPLQGIVGERLDNPKSNLTRSYTAQYTFEAALTSPLIGYGGTRPAQGGTQSIAIGSTPECQQCGNPTLGGNGQFWLVLLAQGFVGAALHVGFFLRMAWAYRRDRSPIGIAGMLTCLLPLLYMFFYNAFVAPLLLVFLSMALYWRNAEHLAAGAADAVRADADSLVRT